MTRPRPDRRVEQLVRVQAPKIGRRTKLRLDLNERVTAWPERIVREVLASIAPADLVSYPETHALYAALARHHGVTPANVLVSGGSELVIRYVFETFLGPGAGLVILDPSFAMFGVYGRLFGADITAVPFDDRFVTPVDRLLDGISPRTRLIAIANPNNPTGTALSEQQLLAVVERAAAVGALVLVDEAYFYFCKQTIAPRVTEFENLIVTRTFSKAFGLAGVRLGYALGAEATIAAVQKVQPIDHANAFAVAFGEYALAHEQLAWDYARDVRDGKAFLVSALRGLGLRVVGEHGNFVLVDLGPARRRIVAALQPHVLIGDSVRLPFPNEFVKITVGPLPEMEALAGLLRPLVLAEAAQSPVTRSQDVGN